MMVNMIHQSIRNVTCLSCISCIVLLCMHTVCWEETQAAPLRAGVSKVDITKEYGPVNDRLYSRALVIKSDTTTVVIVTVDAVSFGEIGPFPMTLCPISELECNRSWA